MNPFRFRTLYAKLAALFSATLLALGVVQFYFSASGWIGFVQESEQRLNWDLAEKIAARIEPHLRSETDYRAVDEALAELLLPPAQYDVYLLEQNGTIIYHQSLPLRVRLKAVATRPIAEFLERRTIAAGPILGEDPKKPGEKTVFSAAPLTIAGKEGFVYVVLGANQYGTILGVLGRSYFLNASIASTIASLAMAAIVGYIGFFLLTKPLRNMVEAVERMKSGDYSARTEVRSDDELRTLSETLNAMAAAVERTVGELEQQNTLRRELVANISHDLRSPLTAMQSCLDTAVLQFDKLPREQVREHLTASQSSLEYLQTLVNELFELSKLEARAVDPVFEPFSIEDLCEDVALQHRAKAEARSLTIHQDYDEQSGPVIGDIGMLGKVVSNLVENAIRYSAPPGNIYIRTRKQQGSVLVEIEDTGIGIPEDELPKIFDRFYRVEPSRSINTGGTGLGLAIVKQMLDIHGVSISVKSAVGKGTTFAFALPSAAGAQSSEDACA